MIQLRKNRNKCPKCKGILIKQIENRQSFGQTLNPTFRCSACGRNFELKVRNNNLNKN